MKKNLLKCHVFIIKTKKKRKLNCFLGGVDNIKIDFSQNINCRQYNDIIYRMRLNNDKFITSNNFVIQTETFL